MVKSKQIGRLLLNEVVTSYTGNDDGQASDLHVLRLSPDWRRTDLDLLESNSYEFKREVAMFLDWYKEESSYDSHTGMGYDCTGKPFGSSWTKLNSEFTKDDFYIVLVHSYAFDI